MRRGSTRTVGLAVSLITALLFVALVGYFYLRGKSGAPARAAAKSTTGQAPPTDIRAGMPGQALGAGKGMEITLVDKRDPTRVSLRILTESSEPQENARYLVQKPQAFVYSRSGVVWHIRADKGRLYIPNTQMQPEAATLEGNVVVRAFDAPPAGEKLDPDAPGMHALARFETAAIQYDGTIGEVTTSEPFKVTTDKADFTAVGLRGIYNQEKERLEYGEIQRDGHLIYKTAGQDPLQRKKKEEPKPGPAAPPTPGVTPPPKPPPVETFYVATLTGGVTVTRGSQSIESDALDSWLRMVDNELSPTAITPSSVKLDPSAPKPVADSTSASAAPADGADASPAAAPTPTTDASAVAEAPSAGLDVLAGRGKAPAPSVAGKDPGVIDLQWTGSMVIRIAEHRPEELARDEVAVRFTTGPDSLCNFRDDAAKAHGTASTIQYGATSQVLTMASIRPDGVVLTADGSGSAITSALSLDMGSGVTTIEGPGTLRDRLDRYITWSDRAEFQFHVGDSGMTSLVETAAASGQVEAIQGEARLRGSDLTAGFVISGAKADVYKLMLRGDAQAADGAGGELSADSIDVAFGQGTGPNAVKAGPMPQTLDAIGNVLGQKDGASLASQTLHVDLAPDDRGRPIATAVAATGSARFTKAEEKTGGRFNLIDAQADEIQAQVDAQIIELMGPNSSVGNLTSKVTGSTIRIDGLRRYVDVFGVGRFEHRGAAIDSDSTSDASVTWTKHVAYDDQVGSVEAEGSVVASNQPDAFTLQTLRADRVRLMLEAQPDGVAPDPNAPPRKLLQAYAYGVSGETPRPAQLEMRVYASPFAAGRERPARVAFLEGGSIIADDVEGTLNVPGSGRMFFSDRRRNDDGAASDAARANAEAAQSANPFGGKFNRGDSRFIWQDSMIVDRRLGMITLKGKSNLRHVRLSDGLPTDIEADTLVGKFRNMQVSQAERSNLELRAEFLGADAQGDVWIRSTDNKELSADRVEYDAESGIAKAMASEGKSVIFFDPTQGVPQRARVLFWDQTHNRIEIRDAGTIVVPK